MVTDKQKAEKAVQRRDRPRTPLPTPCSPSPVFNLTDDPETQPTSLPATAVAGKPASAHGVASLLRDVREDDLQSLSGYRADTPITIKAEPFIWPTAALINIHEHPI